MSLSPKTLCHATVTPSSPRCVLCANVSQVCCSHVGSVLWLRGCVLCATWLAGLYTLSGSVLTELLRTCELWVSAFMWVARARWASLWMVVQLSGEGNSVLHCRCVIGNVVGHLFGSRTAVPVQFDTEGFLYPSFKPSVFSGQDVYFVVLKRMIFLLQM